MNGGDRSKKERDKKTKKEIFTELLHYRNKCSALKQHLTKQKADSIAWQKLAEKGDAKEIVDLTERLHSEQGKVRYWRNAHNDMTEAYKKYYFLASKRKNSLVAITIITAMLCFLLGVLIGSAIA